MTGSEGITNRSRDVVALTQGRDIELLPALSKSHRKLPNEVLLMIFKLLDKSDLKAIRCACKFFESSVSPLLFDKIYISPHRINMDVFRQITEHSDLCRYPRELVYDVQRFKANIDLREYFQNLWDQLRSLSLRWFGSEIHHADKEIEGLLRMARDRLYIYEGYSKYRVVQRGLEIYREKAEEEDHYNSGQLFGCLCIGLMKLPYLDKIEFQTRWKDAYLLSVNLSIPPRDLRMFSSPLARTWSPFHLKPEARFSDVSIVHEFDNVITAFALTKRPLRVLDAHCLVWVPYEKFYTKSRLSRTFHQHGLAAMNSLEFLTLQVDTTPFSKGEDLSDQEHGFAKEKTLSVDLLAAALRHLPRLRRLSLSGGIQDDGNGLLSISELFQAVRFPDLEVLILKAMLGSAADILAFLRMQPRLCQLTLSFIELSEGTWASLVDDMRRWLLLESAVLGLPLRQDGGVDLWDEDAWVDEDIPDQIEEYVLYGGKNPLRALQ
ncbi:hypothetical protein MMC22_004552 [Lobaria immixta]|nr:hypothetical protein [Lobaria immixta]